MPDDETAAAGQVQRRIDPTWPLVSFEESNGIRVRCDRLQHAHALEADEARSKCREQLSDRAPMLAVSAVWTFR